MMPHNDDSFDRDLQQFNRIRDGLVAARKRQDHLEVIRLCLEAIELAHTCPEQQIVDWLFMEDIGLAFERLKEPEKALDYYRKALQGLMKDKGGADWKDTREILERKIARLEKRMRE